MHMYSYTKTLQNIVVSVTLLSKIFCSNTRTFVTLQQRKYVYYAAKDFHKIITNKRKTEPNKQIAV